MKKIKEKVEDLIKIVNEHKKILCMMIVFIYIIIMVVSVGILGIKRESMEGLYYISQIVCGGFAIVGVAVAIIQYTFNSNVNRIEAKKQKKIEAAKMANEFRIKVIPSINKLAIAYSSEKFRKNIIQYLEGKTLNGFDKSELDRLFPEDEYIKYRVELGVNYAMETNQEFRMRLVRYLNDKKMGETEKSSIKRELDDMVNESVYEIGVICTELANMLEYLCICFNTDIADEKTVYQSLHKVFFYGVHMIYIFTFDANINERDRLYYNIMVLYKKWKKIYLEKKEEEEKAEEKIKADIDSMKNKYKKNIAVRPESE